MIFLLILRGIKMFSDKDGKNLDRIETLIGELCSIVGNISGEGLIKIDGSIDGDITWKDDIIIGETALYNGNISCKNAKVNGRVKGNITCEDNLIIEPLGNISGDITEIGRASCRERVS